MGKARHFAKGSAVIFSKQVTNFKTAELVRRIRRAKFTIVDSEQDAFPAGKFLIKEYQPMFNINLKDDKTYPLHRHST